MFRDLLQRLETTLDVPYPERAEVLRELEADLHAHYDALRELGFSDEEARATAARDSGLDDAAQASLSDLHTPAVRRLLANLPPPAREPAEWLAAGISLFTLTFFLIKEVSMFQFMREGGYGMWLVALVAGAALLIQMRRAFTWFISRDHSHAALTRFTNTPLYLAAATLAAAVCGSASGFRVTLASAVEGGYGAEWILSGAYESLAPLIFGGVLAALIILVQGAIAAGLRAMQIRMPV
ncbi:hypothetical protein [Haliangium ochraceum]|uniref:Uncharacterized protein n=1 Tax=Haliangium ochraceum (strain DSM 14365 / JCM 11303 / SMP-2) TaxID=502025 RepID=D0LFT6_HALO1|nr:hypothetical protein [Haliangium ochraceum]ACY14538.1 hypothetical protein Hoch_1992 [Haliangium ochraceum DSM 14365]